MPAVVNDPVAGYVRSLDANSTDKWGGFTYAAVRGAGHMVPHDQPERAFDLISRFVDGNGAGHTTKPLKRISE